MAKRDNWLTAVWTKYLLLKYIILAKAAEDSFEIRKNQLQLALTWNRADIAQEEIFREDVLWPPSMEDLDNFFNLQCTCRLFYPSWLNSISLWFREFRWHSNGSNHWRKGRVCCIDFTTKRRDEGVSLEGEVTTTLPKGQL